MELTRRQRNIIRKMIEGYLFGSLKGPNYMTQKEALALSGYGFATQSDSANGSDPSGGRTYYPLKPPDFAVLAIRYGVVTPEEVISWKPALRSHIEKALEGIPV